MQNQNSVSSRFKVGNPGGPGRGPSGITKIRNKILAIFERHEGPFLAKLEKLAQADPVAFYFTFVNPLMPQKIELDAEVNHNHNLVNITAIDVMKRINEVEKTIDITTTKTVRRIKKGS